MLFNFIRVVLLAVSCYGADYLTEQPDYLMSCKIKEPEFVKCSTQSIQMLFTQLKKGIPGVVKPIDPFELNKVALQQSGTSAANIKAELTNVKVKGFGDTIVKESKVSDKDFSWETRFLVPRVRIDADYSLDGRLLLIPLQGNGDMFFEIENLKAIMYTKTRLYEKGDYTFYNVTSVKFNIEPKRVKSNFNNLFNGNKEIEESTNRLFNENWKDFFEAMRPAILETIEGTFLKLLQSTFNKVPANFFISDIPKSTELYG